jgi:N-acylneuraminate cytidylyltransferase/CMP-N,N'-diacetyllegionaminic acid synthase
MYKGKKTLGVITARGGSRAIPRKNIKELCGKPLIAYTIEAARQSKYLTRCIVSTDDEEIAEVSRRYGAEIPFMRPSELAQDNSTSMEVVLHALRWLKENENSPGEGHFDYLMILQPTSPLRTAEDIDACIEKIVTTDADSVISMMELTDFSIKKLKRIEDDLILPFLEEEGRESTPRHKLSSVYKRNGAAIYLTKTELIERGDLFGAISRPYLMPRERSVDINEPVDFELAEFWMRKLKGVSQEI